MVHEFEELERRGITEAELIEFGTGKLRLAAIEGDMKNGSVMAGQIAGMVHDIIPTKELIERIVAEAEEIIRLKMAEISHIADAHWQGRGDEEWLKKRWTCCSLSKD